MRYGDTRSSESKEAQSPKISLRLLVKAKVMNAEDMRMAAL